VVFIFLIFSGVGVYFLTSDLFKSAARTGLYVFS